MISAPLGDVEIVISQDADCPAQISFRRELRTASRLPLGAITVFNILRCCHIFGCTPQIRPNFADQSIFIDGIENTCFVCGVTITVLGKILQGINIAAYELAEYLETGDGCDYWNSELMPEDESDEE